MTNWIWSDLHLWHTNIIQYCNRPFVTIEEMNETLLTAWRRTVKEKDTIFNLGDFCLGQSKDAISKLVKNLPGKKIIILGNHDRGHSLQWWRDIGFSEVYPYPIIYHKWVILSHEEVFLNDNYPYINIHGHHHNKQFVSSNYINVSVEHTQYKPVSLDEIIEAHSNIEIANLDRDRAI
jgi:calcineurin-like phosphoesterase family protein